MISTHSISAPVSDESTAAAPDLLLDPLFEAATDSSSLIGTRHAVNTAGREAKIPKFLLLGQRGGGRPIRLALFAGLDPASHETVAALARLLLQYEITPSLARDYALFAYPIVNREAFATPPQPLSAFERRYAFATEDEEVRFFQSERRKWTFDGLISLRVDAPATGFHAEVRSTVIGQEVALPALLSIAHTFPLRENALTVRPTDRYSRLADAAQGKLTGPIDGAPEPFEIELFAPGAATAEQRLTGLFLLVQEVLRGYRRFIAHAANL